MRTLKLDICKQSDGFDYGHSKESVAFYEMKLKEIQDFFAHKKIKPQYQNIVGIKVSNSGCNVSLQIKQDGKIHSHSIFTTQNQHLSKFGITPRRTDLDRFVE